MSYEDLVKEVVAGKYDRLELDCEDSAIGVPIDRLEDEIVDNLRCILEEAGLWSRDLSISLAPVPNDVSCDEETGFCIITYDFTIYKDNGWEALAGGTSITEYYVSEDGKHANVSLTYMVMPAAEVKRLYEHIQATKLVSTQ